jgi:hypothetical protein
MRKRHIILAVGATVAVAALGALSMLAVRGQRIDRRRQELSVRLDRSIEDYRRYWKAEGRNAPPVLRGATVEGNAADVQLAAARAMALGDLPPSLVEGLKRCEPPSGEARELAKAHEATLASFRRAAQYRFAWTEMRIEDGMSAEVPSYVPHLRAHRLLLARAALSPPGECLRIAADAVRMSQLMTHGAGLIGLMIAAAEVEIGPAVVIGCARHASREELAAAAAEVDRLVASAPSAGQPLEVEALVAGVTMRDMVRSVRVLPMSAEQVEATVRADTVLDAWEQLQGEPARYRAITATGYPESMAAYERMASAVAASTDPLVGMAVPGMRRYLERDMAVQAKLRATAVLLHAWAERDPGAPFAATAPAALARPALRDPFTGRPLGWTVDGSTGVASVWSAGANRSDDGGRAGSDDIVVRSDCSP